MTIVLRIEAPKFSAFVVEEYEMVAVRLVGNADVPVQGDVAKIISATHQLAQKNGYTRVQMDIRELAFMTSACLKELITWLDQAKANGGTYQIVFLSSESLSWQRRTLHALSRFAQELVTIQVC